MSTPNRGGRGTETSGGDRVTKAERKEQARIEREQIQHQMERKRRTRALILGGILALSAIALAAIVINSGGDDPEPSASGELPGMMTSTSPWAPNTEDLAARIETLGLDQGGHEQVALHNHTRMEIWINGEQVPVPANVGWSDAGSVFAPIHTHEPDGVIHTESADINFTTDLGTVFDVWGLRLTPDCIGAYCTEGDKQVRVFVDGEEVSGNPRDVPIDNETLIVITYGDESQLPTPMPADFIPAA